jgi:hypothetical protein
MFIAGWKMTNEQFCLSHDLDKEGEVRRSVPLAGWEN